MAVGGLRLFTATTVFDECFRACYWIGRRSEATGAQFIRWKVSAVIVTRLIGGLGNQMFQYAYGLHLATVADQPLYLDVSAFDSYKLHHLAIDDLSISAQRLPETERFRVPGRYRGTSRIREILEATIIRSLKLRREKPFGFRNEYVTPSRNLYLDGYWQSDQFFPAMKQRLQW